jgi:hypothetical protein
LCYWRQIKLHNAQLLHKTNTIIFPYTAIRVSQKELYNFESLYKFIRRTCTVL